MKNGEPLLQAKLLRTDPQVNLAAAKIKKENYKYDTACVNTKRCRLLRIQLLF